MSKGFNPMEKMMHKMMGQTEGDGVNPMMKMMMEKMAILATPEVQALFEDWVQEVEKEVVNIFSKIGLPLICWLDFPQRQKA